MIRESMLMLMLRLLIDKASSEEEVDWFMERLNKQVFQLSEISLVAACVASLRRQVEHLVTSSTDVRFLMDVRLQPTTEKLIMEVRDKALESVKLRWAEERWLGHEAGTRDAPLIIILASSVAAVYVANLKNAESKLPMKIFIDPGLHGYRPLLCPLPPPCVWLLGSHAPF